MLATPSANLDLTARALEPATHVVVHIRGWNDDTGAQLRAWLESRGARAIADTDGAWLNALPSR